MGRPGLARATGRLGPACDAWGSLRQHGSMGRHMGRMGRQERSNSMTWHGGHGKAWHGTAWHVMARDGKEEHGMAQHGM
eukprot:169513-Chlamydomonas_euryale.AAC.2